MRLIHDDCINAMNQLIEEGVKVDLILTDPPYSITGNKWDNIIPFDDMWKKIEGLIHDRTPIVFFASQPFTSKLVMSKLDWFRYEWIYQKTVASNFGVAKYQPMREHEEILVFGKKSPNYYPIKEKRKGGGSSRIKYDYHIPNTVSTNYGGLNQKEPVVKRESLRNPSSVRHHNNRSKGNVGLHPTQKPVDLLEYLIKTYTNESDLVLDFTMGSGSTGVACQNTNRDFVGIELDEKYYNIACDRINNSQVKLEEFS